jgi:pSer/pThr/pTyr-binding forkhead associated (FHA) protein
MPKLILTMEAQDKVVYEFVEHSITIGRASENMIVIDDPSVSGMHRLFGRDRHRAIRCFSQF